MKKTGAKRIVRRELLKIDGRAVELNVRLNTRARRLIVKVHPATGEVMVIAPSRRALDRAVEFARSEAAWIARQLAQVPSRVALMPGARIPFRGQEHLIQRSESGPVMCDEDEPVIHVSGRLEHAPRRITVRDTASRWGSCSSTRSLSFSWRLIMAPPFVLDYVVAHEVAHLKEMNHGPAFWRIVRELVGDVRRPQTWLRQHGTALHRYA